MVFRFFNFGSYSKKIRIQTLPDPIVSFGNMKQGKTKMNLYDFQNAKELIPSLNIKEFTIFPGKINSYKILILSASGEKIDEIINQGGSLNSSSNAFLKKVKIGDIVIFDNIYISLNDGTTRNCNPLIVKIYE